MAFIDNLAYSLFSITFAAFLILYTSSSMYLVYRRGKRNFFDYISSASIPLAALGVFMILQALWGQFTWPLPGSYNTLFYDPLLSFGLLLVAFAVSVRLKLRLEYVGFFGLMVGFMVIVYGFQAYEIGLTASPIAMLGMYLLYGLAGVLSYPVSLIADRLPGLKKNVWGGWHVILIAFWILLLLAGCISAITGVVAVSQHLITPP